MNKAALTIAVAAIGLMMPLQTALADSEQALPLLPVLTAQWWQWATSIPVPPMPTAENPDRNPVHDMTGENCMIGQRGPIWFLAGNLSSVGTSVTRACSIPEDKLIFFPVINDLEFNSANFCNNGPTSRTASQARAVAKSIIDSVIKSSVKITVDGKPVQSYRVQSEAFVLALPDENLCPGNLPSESTGIFSPAVDDGYYVLLAPLKPGSPHTVFFHAEDPSAGTQDVTYNLTIVPVSLK